MVSIEKSYLDVAPGPELKLCWCLEWQGFKDFVKVLVGLLSGLEDAPGVVDSTRVSLKTEENFPSGRRAVDEGRSKGIEAGQVVGVDVAEEAGQRRPCMAVVPKVVNPDVRKLGYAAVKGGHGGRRTPTPTGEARLG
jgi:hypothetical protein